MTLSFVRAQKIVVLVAAGALWCGAAIAQPAPITYAGASGQGAGPALSMSSTAASSVDHNLVGGGDGSYGYGAQRGERQGAVIDLRRNAARTVREEAPTPISFTTNEPTQTREEQAAPREQGAQQAWLEQERVGPPYEAGGQWYVPTPEPGYSETGQASWYGPNFHGQATASGETFDETAISAAHPTLPIPSLVQVTNLENGREVIVRVNDRGPFVGNRLIDVSRRTAEVLGFENQGQARVHVRYLGPAPRHVTVNENERPALRTTQNAAPIQRVAQDVGMTNDEGPVSLLPPGAAAEPVAVVAPMERPVFAVQNAVAPVAGGFMVQVGAFADLDNAHRVQSTLANVGQVVVDARQTARGELFRVRVGPWATRGEAEAARRQIANLGFGDAVLASN